MIILSIMRDWIETINRDICLDVNERLTMNETKAKAGLSAIQKTDDLLEDKPIDLDSICPKTNKPHVPDWNTVSISYDVETYIDVACKDCGRSGCVGSSKTLEENIQW